VPTPLAKMCRIKGALCTQCHNSKGFFFRSCEKMTANVIDKSEFNGEDSKSKSPQNGFLRVPCASFNTSYLTASDKYLCYSCSLDQEFSVQVGGTNLNWLNDVTNYLSERRKLVKSGGDGLSLPFPRPPAGLPALREGDLQLLFAKNVDDQVLQVSKITCVFCYNKPSKLHCFRDFLFDLSPALVSAIRTEYFARGRPGVPEKKGHATSKLFCPQSNFEPIHQDRVCPECVDKERCVRNEVSEHFDHAGDLERKLFGQWIRARCTDRFLPRPKLQMRSEQIAAKTDSMSGSGLGNSRPTTSGLRPVRTLAKELLDLMNEDWKRRTGHEWPWSG
jgi:hypothetical protein